MSIFAHGARGDDEPEIAEPEPPTINKMFGRGFFEEMGNKALKSSDPVQNGFYTAMRTGG